MIRDAIDRHLGLSSPGAARSALDGLLAAGAVRRPRSPYRKPVERLAAPPGVTSADLLDRDDRI